MTYDCMDAEDSGMCLLAILTINDRVIQLAIIQCLQPIIDPDFSAHSYGVNPNRSAHTRQYGCEKEQNKAMPIQFDIDLLN